MRALLLPLVIAVLAVAVAAQEGHQTGSEPPADFRAPEWFGLDHLSAYLGLKPDDISFRSDYTEADSFRLETVARLMAEPLDMISYADSLRHAHVTGQPEILAGIMFKDLAWEHQSYRSAPYQASAAELHQTYNLYFTDIRLNQLLTRAATYLDVILPKSAEMSLARLTREERHFLKNEFKELLVIHEEEEFLSVEATDSIEKVEEESCERFVEFGNRLDKDPIMSAGINCLRELMLEIGAVRRALQSGDITAAEMIEGSGPLPKGSHAETYLGMQPGWKVGGPGNDYYNGDYRFIIDLGGDDVYDLTYDIDNPHSVIIIDLDGDDRYRGKSDFTLGSGCFGVGLHLDFGGNDTYEAKSFSIGSGYFGLGLLYDVEGEDVYTGDTHVQGAGSFGLGVLIDESGRDLMQASLFAQGFGFVGGCGIIYDEEGSDQYYVGGKYKDVLRYDNHYLTLAQGFGYGLRPWMSGGIGAIVDLDGNDSYYSDIFGQGSSYWWSLGVIYDSAGNDNYQSFQYAQGSAAHMTLGALIDDSGDDVYFAKGVSQGCGHDYSCGLLLDRGGNDTYTAYDLSQAAGSANGAGVMIDTDGDDRYFIKKPTNSQGYGNPRRDFGSIGLFIDLGGSDQYAGNGADDYYWKTDSKWGGGMDIQWILPDSVEDEQ